MVKNKYYRPVIRSETIDIGVYGQYGSPDNTPALTLGGVMCGPCCPN
ncbi:MAG: hypothetical protein SVJ22_11630 [Halobacteriota archaeon]|nr:hypothetical protein [Halobacteriota archaeon]